MKITLLNPAFWLKVMRISSVQIVLLLVCAGVSLAADIEAQVLEKRVSLNVEEQEIVKTLREIEKQAAVKFVFSPQVIRAGQKINVRSRQEKLGELLDKMLAPLGIGYEVSGKYILLSDDRSGLQLQDESRLPVLPADPDRVVRGKVTDERGEVLPGVNILIKDTQQGTTTDSNGYFSLSVPDEKAVLSFSFVGYLSQEIVVNNQAMLDIILKIDQKALEEVVVVGYGTQSKRNVTGAVSKVNMKDTENLPTTNIAQSLRGRVSGVQFTDSGRPGQNGTILIRGPRSLSGGNNPLIILDGIFFNGSMTDINPNDIESMEILKDASAAAIYGSRAANGVILITSKKGAGEKPTIRLNQYSGLSGWSYKPKLLSPERYIQKTLDARIQNRLEADPARITEYLRSSEAANYQKGVTTDPWKEISQSSRISSSDLSLSGSTSKTNYFVSFSHVNEKGLIFNDNQERVSIRTNIENEITSWLKIGSNTTYIRRNLSGNEASPASAYRASPFGTWYHEDGSPLINGYVSEDVYGTNTLWTARIARNEEIYNNLFANFYAIIDIPFIKGLRYRLNYSPNYRWQHNYNFVPQDRSLTTNNSRASKFVREDFDWVIENIVTYDYQIDKNHALDLTLLYGRNHFGWESTTATAQQLSTNFSGWNNLALGSVLTNNSDASAIEGISSMFRLNYRFLDKYLFTVTARRDGCSVFSANNKYASFPSAAFAWIVSEEPFMRSVPAVDYLKLRISYGSTGNQAISPYRSLTMVQSSPLYVFGNSGTSSIGSIPENMGNSGLKWETTYSTNVALDFDLFKGRLGGTIEAYSMNTKDLLVNRSLPNATGYLSVMTNLGATSNYGLKISLNSVNVRKNSFEWHSSLVFSNNRNKIVHLYRSDIDGDGKEDNDLGNRWLIGHPINIAYDYITDVIYLEGDDLPRGYPAGYT